MHVFVFMIVQVRILQIRTQYIPNRSKTSTGREIVKQGQARDSKVKAQFIKSTLVLLSFIIGSFSPWIIFMKLAEEALALSFLTLMVLVIYLTLKIWSKFIKSSSTPKAQTKNQNPKPNPFIKLTARIHPINPVKPNPPKKSNHNKIISYSYLFLFPPPNKLPR